MISSPSSKSAASSSVAVRVISKSTAISIGAMGTKSISSSVAPAALVSVPTFACKLLRTEEVAVMSVTVTVSWLISSEVATDDSNSVAKSAYASLCGSRTASSSTVTAIDVATVVLATT